MIASAMHRLRQCLGVIAPVTVIAVTVIAAAIPLCGRRSGRGGMMARRVVLGVLAGGLAAWLWGCGMSGNPGYRFKMTVEVDTPDGVRTGSSVYEVETMGSRDLVAGGKGSRFTLRGEAVAVDLPGGQTLFALLKTVAQSGHDDLGVSSMVAMDPAFDYDWMASTRKIASGDGIKSPTELPAGYFPMLVMFRDIRVPKTVELVDPRAFGVRRIVVEVTDEAVTSGIEERLEWLGKFPEPSLDPKHGPDDFSLPATLKHGAFHQGMQ